MKKIQNNFYFIQNNKMNNNSFILVNKIFCYIIDPSWNGKEIITFIQDNNLILKGIILTHLHWDHVGDTGKILNKIECDSIYISEKGREIVENISNRLFIYDEKFKTYNIKYVNDFSKFDDELIKFVITPGHSECSMCIIFNDYIITGDHIFLEDIGRVDLDFSSKEDMKKSIIKFKEIVRKLKIIKILPGHGDFGNISDVLSKNKYIL